jgi:hypothetical protein
MTGAQSGSSILKQIRKTKYKKFQAMVAPKNI